MNPGATRGCFFLELSRICFSVKRQPKKKTLYAAATIKNYLISVMVEFAFLLSHKSTRFSLAESETESCVSEGECFIWSESFKNVITTTNKYGNLN